jgi:hypothetical protein
LITGIGLVAWSFQTITGVDLPVRTMAYYAPGAKVCLIILAHRGYLTWILENGRNSFAIIKDVNQ